MKKMNNRGFTIVELVTSFSLTTVVLVFLFNIVLLLKENYVSNALKSDLIVNQSLISTALNEDLYTNGISISGGASCDTGYDDCFMIDTTDKGKIKLSISTSNDKVKYGDTEFSDDSLTLESSKVCYKTYDNVSLNLNSYLQIKVVFKSNVVTEQKFGFNVVYLFDEDAFDVSNLEGC